MNEALLRKLLGASGLGDIPERRNPKPLYRKRPEEDDSRWFHPPMTEFVLPAHWRAPPEPPPPFGARPWLFNTRAAALAPPIFPDPFEPGGVYDYYHPGIPKGRKHGSYGMKNWPIYPWESHTSMTEV